MLKISTNMWFCGERTKSVKENRDNLIMGAFTLDVKSVLK
jgi:hypothetical protein